jgi:hypothetical protein
MLHFPHGRANFLKILHFIRASASHPCGLVRSVTVSVSSLSSTTRIGGSLLCRCAPSGRRGRRPLRIGAASLIHCVTLSEVERCYFVATHRKNNLHAVEFLFCVAAKQKRESQRASGVSQGALKMLLRAQGLLAYLARPCLADARHSALATTQGQSSTACGLFLYNAISLPHLHTTLRVTQRELQVCAIFHRFIKAALCSV